MFREQSIVKQFEIYNVNTINPATLPPLDRRRSERTLFRVFSSYPNYVYLYTLTGSALFVFQIEDAMLMFDKQTNRHRGKCDNVVFCSEVGQR